MDIDKKVDEMLGKIYDKTKPVSIFVYGSRARSDFKKVSDYEVGILFEKDKKWSRSELQQIHELDNLNLYPFIYEDFVKYSLDTPFPRVVYLRELLSGAKTIRGKKVVEEMGLPAVKTSDLLEVAIFQIAYALGAVMSSRQNDWITTSIEFTKSALFSARVLIILETKKFPLEYGEIAKEAIKLELEPQFKGLIKHAIEVRSGTKPDLIQLYTNITFINQVVLQRVKDDLKKGNRILLNGKQI